MKENRRTTQSIEQAKADLYRRFSTRGLRRRQHRHWVVKISAAVLIRIATGAKRGVDLALSIVLLGMLSPLMAAVFLISKGRLRRDAMVGRWCESFDRYSFAETDSALGRLAAGVRLNDLPVLFNIFKGEMSFVGPRPVTNGSLSPRERAARRRYNVRPGLICLWWVRRRANIDFDNEVKADDEYIDTQSIWGDLGIALRAVPAIIYGESGYQLSDEVRILDIRIDNLTMSETIEIILNRLDGEQPGQVCFVNADCANIAYRDEEYRRVLNAADLTLADGIGLKLAGKVLGREIKQNVNGTDLFPRLCEALSGTGKGLYLFGAKPGVADAVREYVHQHYPGTLISGCQHGFYTPDQEPEVLAKVRASGASIMLVALGAPRQDKWISTRLDQLGVKVAIGVGGQFDFYSGNVSRAPLWMREIGFEWLYRFLQEPGRMWKRYFIGNAVFLFRVLREKRYVEKPGNRLEE
jgi:N-acetylglucosaminyldiphosphoundecaprenol N-acetyl-beta-D-mannosaminyltransferase